MKNWAVVPFGILGLLIGAEFASILLLNGGTFSYSLDDPYIHLALAENLARGHYGVNMGEFSSASSSVLWPLLLTPFAFFSAGAWAPLLLNTIFAFWTLLLLWRILVAEIFPGQGARNPFLAAATATLLILATNMVGLIFTGMEHSLQIFLTVAVFAGLVLEIRKGRVPWWFVAALVAGPLVRYENCAISLAAIAFLALRGHYRVSLTALVLTVLPLAAFSLYLHALGLPALPTSVLAKSQALSGAGGILKFAHALKRNLGFYEGSLMAVGLALLALRLLRCDAREDRYLAGASIGAVCAHMVGGSFGWFGRYEIYMECFLILSLLYLHRSALAEFIARHSTARALLTAVLLACVVSPSYLTVLLRTPRAANEIYQQQYQMHRFVTQYYRAPVAVNDLGWVSYRNDNYVLDLWGLGSAKALAARQAQSDVTWMDDLAREKGVGLVMIYDHWFTGVPANWFRLGQLHAQRPPVITGGNRVAFYATGKDSYNQLKPLLADFAKTLPAGTTFEFEAEKR